MSRLLSERFGKVPASNSVSGPDRESWDFVDLFRWHLERGTNPALPRSQAGQKWTVKRLAGALNVDEKNVRNWYTGAHRPSDGYLDAIEKAFFGSNPELDEWKLELRTAHGRARAGSAGEVRSQKFPKAVSKEPGNGAENPGKATELTPIESHLTGANVPSNNGGATQAESAALKRLREKAVAGDGHAQNLLGWMYREGSEVPQSDEEAVKWFRAAAENGDAQGQDSLGWMYKEGRGVSRSDEEAVKWFRAAAEKNNHQGQNNLAWMYFEGRGIPQNDDEAAKWFRAAAENGNAYAQDRLGWMYQEGRGVPQSDDEAVKWYRVAAENGSEQGLINLTRMKQERRGSAQWVFVRAWEQVAGRWKVADGHATYVRPRSPGDTYGICISHVMFDQGRISAKIKTAKSIHARILIGYKSPDADYFIIGLGGYSHAYSLAHFTNGLWYPLKCVGYEDDIETGKVYSIDVELRGMTISLIANGAIIFEHVLSAPVPAGPLGIFAWGEQGADVEFIEVAVAQ
jgi:hypothetical protein